MSDEYSDTTCNDCRSMCYYAVEIWHYNIKVEEYSLHWKDIPTNHILYRQFVAKNIDPTLIDVSVGEYFSSNNIGQLSRTVLDNKNLTKEIVDNNLIKGESKC